MQASGDSRTRWTQWLYDRQSLGEYSVQDSGPKNLPIYIKM